MSFRLWWSRGSPFRINQWFFPSCDFHSHVLKVRPWEMNPLELWNCCRIDSFCSWNSRWNSRWNHGVSALQIFHGIFSELQKWITTEIFGEHTTTLIWDYFCTRNVIVLLWKSPRKSGVRRVDATGRACGSETCLGHQILWVYDMTDHRDISWNIHGILMENWWNMCGLLWTILDMCKQKWHRRIDAIWSLGDFGQTKNHQIKGTPKKPPKNYWWIIHFIFTEKRRGP